MLDDGGSIVAPDVREGVRSAERTDKQAVALREVSRSGCSGKHSDKAAVAVLAVSGRDSFADNAALGSLSYVNHLRSRIGLLVVVGHGD